jgi:CDP-diacylglycerol--glycerol-3-phosphate 3-phosphatidyltransferase
VNATHRQSAAISSVSPASVEAPANKFLTVPNILSLLRASLVIPFLLVMLSSMPSASVWGCVLMGVAALTDNLDGVLARKYRQTSEWGRILDPLADKIGVAAAVVVLLVLNSLPVWFAAFVFGRDVLILLGGLYLKSTRGVVLPSNTAGKWAVGFIILTLFLLLAGLRSLVTDVMMLATSAMLVLSVGLYISRFVDVIKNSRVSGHGTF